MQTHKTEGYKAQHVRTLVLLSSLCACCVYVDTCLRIFSYSRGLSLDLTFIYVHDSVCVCVCKPLIDLIDFYFPSNIILTEIN